MINQKRKVLMSIKPEYVSQIINKKKLYEFRKAVFNHKDIEKVVIYASAPVKKIVAEFEVGDIYCDHPELIWDKYKYAAGIDEKSFMEYFFDREKAFSIHIDNLNVYDEPINPYEVLEGFKPPQSYMFFNEKLNQLYENFNIEAS